MEREDSMEENHLEQFTREQHKLKQKRKYKTSASRLHKHERQYVGQYQPHKSRKRREHVTPGPGGYDIPSTFESVRYHRAGKDSYSFPRCVRDAALPTKKKDNRDFITENMNLAHHAKTATLKGRTNRQLFNLSSNPGPGSYDCYQDDHDDHGNTIPHSPRKLDRKCRKTNKPGPGDYDTSQMHTMVQEVEEHGKKFARNPRFGEIPMSPV